MAETTANALLLDAIRAEGEPEQALEAYVAAQAQPALESGVASSANVYRLRLQNAPAAALGEGVYFAAYQLPRGDAIAGLSTLQREAGGGWGRLGLAGYAKIADYGRPDPAGEAGPESIMIVISHPTDIGYDELYNEWYTGNHMIDVAKSPHFRSATRYRPVAQLGIPLPYLCIYEIEHAFTPELHQGLMHWLTETPDDFRQPTPKTPAGEAVLTLDVWGYCERVWSGVAE